MNDSGNGNRWTSRITFIILLLVHLLDVCSNYKKRYQLRPTDSSVEYSDHWLIRTVLKSLTHKEEDVCISIVCQSYHILFSWTDNLYCIHYNSYYVQAKIVITSFGSSNMCSLNTNDVRMNRWLKSSNGLIPCQRN